MIRSSLCNYIDVYVLVSGRVTITGERAGDNAKDTVERDKEVMFKNFGPYTKCISEIKNTQVDDAIGMPMYNLIKYCDNCSETFGSLW